MIILLNVAKNNTFLPQTGSILDCHSFQILTFITAHILITFSTLTWPSDIKLIRRHRSPPLPNHFVPLPTRGSSSLALHCQVTGGLLLMPCGSTVLCSSLLHTYAPATTTSASTAPSVVSGCDKSPRCCNITFTTFRICCCFNYLYSLHSHTQQRWVCARVFVWKTGPSEAWVWMAVCASEQATATGECKHKGPM